MKKKQAEMFEKLKVGVQLVREDSGNIGKENGSFLAVEYQISIKYGLLRHKERCKIRCVGKI